MAHSRNRKTLRTFRTFFALAKPSQVTLFCNLGITCKGADLVKKKIWGCMVLAICLPLGVMAQNDTVETTSWVTQMQTTSYLTGRGGHSSIEERSESTLYFNDGFGRLTEFHMEQRGQVMTLTIRQNMNIVWQGHETVARNYFSVSREERIGEVYFRILMGDKAYKAFSDANDHWNVVEIKRNEELVGDSTKKIEL